MCVQANFADIYFRGLRDKSMRSGTELAREIQLTDWSTAGEQGGCLPFTRKNRLGDGCSKWDALNPDWKFPQGCARTIYKSSLEDSKL